MPVLRAKFVATARDRAECAGWADADVGYELVTYRVLAQRIRSDGVRMMHMSKAHFASIAIRSDGLRTMRMSKARSASISHQNR